MKLKTLVFLLFQCSPLVCLGQAYDEPFIDGPMGKLSLRIDYPARFREDRDKRPVVILMHGVMANKTAPPLPHIAKTLAKNGYICLRFDFDAQGKSEGDVLDNTVLTEIDDAMAVYDYACKLPYSESVSIIGHSQGGVVAAMLAGRLEVQGRAPKSLVLLAPGTVIKDYALEGKFLGVECDPVDPPEYVQVQWYKFGRKYIKTAQTLPIFEEAGQYTGPVCIIHGSEDLIVPFRYGEEMKGIYSDCTLHRISGDGHLFLAKLRKVESLILKFLGRQ